MLGNDGLPLLYRSRVTLLNCDLARGDSMCLDLHSGAKWGFQGRSLGVIYIPSSVAGTDIFLKKKMFSAVLKGFSNQVTYVSACHLHVQVSISSTLLYFDPVTRAECFELKLIFSATGEMHAEHLGCHVVHPSVLDFWSGRLGWVRQHVVLCAMHFLPIANVFVFACVYYLFNYFSRVFEVLLAQLRVGYLSYVINKLNLTEAPCQLRLSPSVNPNTIPPAATSYTLCFFRNEGAATTDSRNYRDKRRIM